MAKYRALTKLFLFTDIIPEGRLFEVNDDWPPNNNVEPIDDAAKAALEKYFEDRPDARIDPIDQLPVHTGVSLLPEESVDTDPVIEVSLAEAAASKAKPGLGEEGPTKASTSPSSK